MFNESGMCHIPQHIPVTVISLELELATVSAHSPFLEGLIVVYLVHGMLYSQALFTSLSVACRA